MRNRLLDTRNGLAIAIAMLLAAACSREGAAPAVDSQVNPAATNVPAQDTPPANTGASGSNPLMVATEGGPGPYVANSAGSALYAVAGDTDGSKCTGDCTIAWPPMLVSNAMPSESIGLERGMVGVIERADGNLQVAYNSQPLYRYAGDGGAGTTAGHGVSDKWGQWALVSPQGTRLGKP